MRDAVARTFINNNSCALVFFVFVGRGFLNSASEAHWGRLHRGYQVQSSFLSQCRGGSGPRYFPTSERKKRRLTIEKAKATSESRVQSPDAADSCAPKPDPDAAVATRASSTIEPDCRIFGVRKPGREQVVLRVRRRGDI